MKLLAVVAGLVLVAAPAAEAKFKISLTVEPAQVWAKRPARVLMRTGIALPKDHGLRLHVVGPGPARYDTAVFYLRPSRIGSRTFKATVRFPRGGRWLLIVPNWGGRRVKVQPGP
jgi:hypothetical protein